MSDKVQAYRGPLVTANGIILGFVLNFANIWTKQETPLGDGLAYLVLFCLIIGTGLMVVSLFRILSMGVPIEHVEKNYTKTTVFL